MWSYDVREWEINHTGNFGSTIHQVRSNLIKYLHSCNYNKNQIILMHDNKKCTQYFDYLLNIFVKKGVSFNLPKFNIPKDTSN